MTISSETDVVGSFIKVGDELSDGKLRVVEELGRGGMGIVYRARDEELGRDVALKVLLEMCPEDLYWLKQEFRALHGLGHPNLVRFYDLSTSESGAFFTMELLDGRDILTYARSLRSAGQAAPASQNDLFGQLACGIDALHRAGKVHRDIKPSNVFVARTGRVVLLDFGLAVPRIPRNIRNASRSFAGTLQYVAPEQIYGAVSAAGDWYGFGATLYEVLTDRVPFEGSFDEIVDAKTQGSFTPVTDHAPWVQEPLSRLVTALLHPDPRARPSGPEVLRALGNVAAAPVFVAAEVASSEDHHFIGRERELSELMDIARRRSDGSPRVVHVAGPSGIGKSDLVRRLASDLARHEPWTVLFSRCHPQEFVPYKALDEAIDELGSVLSRRSPESSRRSPTDGAALLRVFPTLARVPSLAATSEATTAATPGDPGSSPVLSSMDPHEIRRRAFLALRDLLASLVASEPVALVIDDFQWGDLDSLALLETLLSPPGAPPILLVLSYRSEDVQTSQVLRALFEPSRAPLGSAAHKVELGPLSLEDSATLARTLLSTRQGVPDASIADIARESNGSPLFVGELARSYGVAPLAEHVGAERSLRVKDVIARRIQALPPDARRVLDVVSVAGRPIPRPIALEASGLPAGERDPLLLLFDHTLLRGTTADEAPAVAAYHDQVREAVVATMPPDVLANCHLQIARALESRPDPDPAVLAEHYLGAGNGERAARYAEDGGDRAAQALAFDRAAQLYRIAMSQPARDAQLLRIKLAEALANAGRGAESGEIYLTAADRADTRAPEALASLELRRKAAEQFLHCGMILRGKQVMGAVLDELGVTLPMTPAAAQRAALSSRLRMLVRGTRFIPKAATDVPKPVLARLDALWGASTGLAMVDHVAADALGVRHLFESLEAGEPSRVLRCMGYEAAFEARLGGPFFQGRALDLLSKARALAAQTRDPYDAAWMELCESSMRWFFFDWQAVLRASEAALEGFRDRCRGTDWEMAVTSIFLLSALSYTGKLDRLAKQARDAVRSARDRGDDFAANVYRMLPHMVSLAADKPEHALEEADDAIKTWSVTGDFHLQHYHHAVATTQAHLYAGQPWAALRRLTTAWPGLTKAAFLALPAIAAEMAHLRARTAIAILASGEPPPPDLHDWTVEKLRKTMNQDLKTIGRTSFPLTKPFLASIRGALAQAGGDRSTAEREWARATIGFAGAKMRLYELSAQYRLGQVLGGGAGKTLMLSSCDEVGAAGASRPERMIRLLCPAFV